MLENTLPQGYEVGKQLSLKPFIPSMNQEGSREGEGAYLGAESLALLQSLFLQHWLEFLSPLNNSCNVEKCYLGTANMFVLAEQSSIASI